MQKKKYTKEHIIKSLKDCYHSAGKISQNIYTQKGYKPSVDVIARRFGSWNQALKEAGIPVQKQNNKKDKVLKIGKFSNEYIIQQLKNCYEKHGSISMTLYSKERYQPGRTTIVRQFGSWNNAIEAAGLKAITNHERQFSDEEVLEQLKACYKENNNFISMDIYKDSGRTPTPATIIKYFGSWNNAIEAAGLKANASNIEIYSDEDYIQSLRACYKRNGNYITVPLYRKQKYRPTLNSIRKRFGTWNKALQFANIPINKEANQHYKKEKLIAILHDFYKTNGKITRVMYSSSGQLPHLHTIISYFGSWENALKEAGISLTRDNKQYTKRDVISSIQSCYDQFKRPISVTDYTNSGFEPKLATIRRLFGSWEVAAREAGIPEYFTQYTKDEIIEILQECYEENLGSLTLHEYRELREEPSLSYIINMFNGSWNEALASASLPLNKNIKTTKTH